MHIYGRNWKRRELEARVGKIETIGGVRRFRIEDGPEHGVELIQVRNGAGLTYYLNASRALDISLAEYRGVPLSWHSVNGDVHPAYYNPDGTEWSRTAAGGLLMTCGLTQVGSPCQDGEDKLGIHGRIHHTPTRDVSAYGFWDGDDYHMQIRGIMQESRIFAENMQLTREIKTRLGENKIVIHDTVENIGFQTTPFMILYHFNFGFPLMTENTIIEFPSHQVIPRDQHIPVDGFDRWQTPEVNYQERVYYHQIDQAKVNDNLATVYIRNSSFPIEAGNGKIPVTVRLAWNIDNLPNLIQWKMPAAGVYALGIEPANCHVEGRVAERNNKTLIMLEPGESKHYYLELEIVEE
ncbi:aldose 1-epimerase family protein [candidate division KSB1 bacterium]|nr:aldose 1-epimerase family protein [candidate division KSB1 bacterium]